MKIVKPSNLLSEIPDPPKQLYCYGDTSLLNKCCISIVGTRSITSYGMKVLDMFIAPFLKELEIVVVSGLARGIDTAIPACNREIWKEIQKTELLIAEHREGTKLNKYMYIERNRILAGVSKSVIVIEAGENSGSLTTAQLALDYNRDVYVVPGNITSNVSRGCNLLAKQGANILTSIEDMKEVVGLVGGQFSFYY